MIVVPGIEGGESGEHDFLRRASWAIHTAFDPSLGVQLDDASSDDPVQVDVVRVPERPAALTEASPVEGVMDLLRSPLGYAIEVQAADLVVTHFFSQGTSGAHKPCALSGCPMMQHMASFS